MTMPRRPSTSPARSRPDAWAVEQRAASGAALPNDLTRKQLQALATALGLPATPPTKELVRTVETKLQPTTRPPRAAPCQSSAADDLEREAVRAAFRLIDANGDGTLSRIEVIKAVRSMPQVRSLLALPASIRQEDGTRDAFERVYQAIDADDSKSITCAEFETYFFPPAKVGAATARPADSGEVVMRALNALQLALLGVSVLLLALCFVASPPPDYRPGEIRTWAEGDRSLLDGFIA